MHLRHHSKEEAIEILTYLAAEDPLISLREVKWMKLGEVRDLLKDVAEHLKRDTQSDQSHAMHNVTQDPDGLSLQAKQIISTLSPREEKLLYKTFKLN